MKNILITTLPFARIVSRIGIGLDNLYLKHSV